VRVLQIVRDADRSIRAEHPTDLLCNLLRTLQHFAIPKSENFEPSRSKLASSHIVIVLPRVRMSFAINLDDHASFDAAEIDDE
jgi:hypothetical protein